MSKYRQIIESKKYIFEDTAFDRLMQRRIYKVLLICNLYDAFILEEDGRIDEKIFNEYFSQNLRYPPIFIQAHTVAEAFKVLKNEPIDLIITMLTVEGVNAFNLAQKIKESYTEKPIVVLTPFSREVSLWVEREEKNSIDYIFCWLGNADILLAIIKLIEDRMNLNHDVEEAGVQAILLIEDSIRYYSSYLPNIYKIFFQQSKRTINEGLNEHQKMLLMRGRPKILLATNYNDAIILFDKYKENLIGVISDMSYKVNGVKEPHAGIMLYEKVHAEDKFMPFLLQSNDAANEKIAKSINVDFINKYSKSLSLELHDYITHNLAFGDFIFKNPNTGEELCRAPDLKILQEKVLTVSDETIEFHVKRNDFSKWMNARSLFPLGRMFKYLTYNDFKSTEEVRGFIYEAISVYRKYRGKGVIAKFSRKNFDEYLNFSRIGDGSIGGKARGLAFLDVILKKHELSDKWEGIKVHIPRTVVLSVEVYDEFIESNNLSKKAIEINSDEEILQLFINCDLPTKAFNELKTFISLTNGPMAIRSSSKLEDSHYQPFAGIYTTYMVPNIKSNKKLTLKFLTQAIKCVYASVYYKGSRAYMTATANMIDEEKMGIILQEVCGKQYGNIFYPVISGVARSINFYPIAPEKTEDGIVSIAFGLGKYVVEGGQSLRFSPEYPKKILQLSTPDMALRDTQKEFYALQLSENSFKPSTDDGVNIVKIPIKEVENETSFLYAGSTFDYENHIIRDGIVEGGKKIITFSNVLQHNMFPFSQILSELLKICQKEMGNPVEIEFAVDADVLEGESRIFNVLQIRPIVENKEKISINLNNISNDNVILKSNSVLGNGIINNLFDIVYIKPEGFNFAKSVDIAQEIEKINDLFVKQNKNYILIGPGRWGSSDHWLGIPVKWHQISAAQLIVESGMKDHRIDPSQGTHFFQNLTSFRVGYFTVNPFLSEDFYDVDYLNSLPIEFENEYIRHVKFTKSIVVKIDGKNNCGVIFKPV